MPVVVAFAEVEANEMPLRQVLNDIHEYCWVG
jgi:hypothetical protein